jgi:beta-glucosidase
VGDTVYSGERTGRVRPVLGIVWDVERTRKSDCAFVTALKHMASATLLAEEAILDVQPRALFVQSESSEFYHPEEPTALARAAFLNERRFVALDLLYGRDVIAAIYNYLIENGMSRTEYQWQMEHGARLRQACILGNDYYASNEHSVPADGDVTPSGEIFGYYNITSDYARRYHIPVMHTETNHRESGQEARTWLKKQWANLLRLKDHGYPMMGFTWFSLVDQVDWDTALRQDRGHVDELGLFDLNRHIRPVGEAYRRLIQTWGQILAAETQEVELQSV